MFYSKSLLKVGISNNTYYLIIIIRYSSTLLKQHCLYFFIPFNNRFKSFIIKLLFLVIFKLVYMSTLYFSDNSNVNAHMRPGQLKLDITRILMLNKQVVLSHCFNVWWGTYFTNRCIIRDTMVRLRACIFRNRKKICFYFLTFVYFFKKSNIIIILTRLALLSI